MLKIQLLTVDWTVTLEHSRWNNHLRTQLMGQLHSDTVDGKVT